MKIPSWWPHDNTPPQRDLETERLQGRIGVLTKRVEQLELQFGNLWEDCCSMWDRIKSLENQNLWGETPKPENLEDVQAYHESKLKAWLNEEKPKKKQKK